MVRTNMIGMIYSGSHGWIVVVNNVRKNGDNV